jgi:hypothetical protein
MRILDRLRERRHRKAHEHHLAERARQQELSGQDAQQAVRDIAQRSGAAQQGTYGHGA